MVGHVALWPPHAPLPAIPEHWDLSSGDFVPFQITIHDGEEHLEEKVDRIYNDGKEV